MSRIDSLRIFSDIVPPSRCVSGERNKSAKHINANIEVRCTIGRVSSAFFWGWGLGLHRQREGEDPGQGGHSAGPAAPHLRRQAARGLPCSVVALWHLPLIQSRWKRYEEMFIRSPGTLIILNGTVRACVLSTCWSAIKYPRVAEISFWSIFGFGLRVDRFLN